jgi:CRISPR-associated exonuclease Cas4
MSWLLLALALVVAAVVLLWVSHGQRASTGLPKGQVVYADTGAWKRNERPLFSARYRLTGKPDYLVRERGRMVPVDVKPGRSATTPYEGDLLQLAAYCLLVEEQYGQRPAFGYLKYSQALFRIDYDDRLREALQAALQQMRLQWQARDVAPSHDEPKRCLYCGHREACSRRLV